MPEWPGTSAAQCIQAGARTRRAAGGPVVRPGQPHRGGDSCRRGLRLDRDRRRARAQRHHHAAAATAGHARRHSRARLPRAVERAGDYQARARRGRALAADSFCAECRGGAQSGGRNALSAAGHSRRLRDAARQRLRPHPGLPHERASRHLRAGADGNASAALKEIEAIAAVDGVDGIFIGPSDLAADFRPSRQSQAS